MSDHRHQRFDIVLLDADETVYDFKLAEKTAVSLTLQAFGVEPTDEVVSRYSAINLSCWKALERGELSREALKPTRFQRLFEELGIDCLLAAPSRTSRCSRPSLRVRTSR